MKLPPLKPWRSCTDVRVLGCGGVSQELCWGECRRSERVNAWYKGKVTKRLCSGGAFGPKWPKREPKRAEGSQQGAKREPTEAKSEPKGAKREPTGAKREPKGDKRGPKWSLWRTLGRPGGSRSQKVKKAHWILTILRSILHNFGTILGPFRVSVASPCGVLRCVVRCCVATISGVRRVVLRCVVVRRVVLCREKREMRGRQFHCQFHSKI